MALGGAVARIRLPFFSIGPRKSLRHTNMAHRTVVHCALRSAASGKHKHADSRAGLHVARKLEVHVPVGCMDVGMPQHRLVGLRREVPPLIQLLQSPEFRLEPVTVSSPPI